MARNVGLSALIVHKEERGVISGIRIYDGASSVHHLLFADDSFLFGKAKLEKCAEVQHILDLFSQASGQEINLGKSSIAFSANVRGHVQQGLANFLGVQLVERHEIYLGLPTFVGKNKRQTFAYIKERVHKRLCGWKGKCLSGAGRELLVKVVAQWGSDPDSRKIHWKSWDKLCLAKPEGGMGFRNLYAFNLAVLAKQGWRILQDPESLTTSILKARIVLEKLSRWLIGDGASVRVWKDQWRRIWSIFVLYQLAIVYLRTSLYDITLIEDNSRLKVFMRVAWDYVKPPSLSASSSALGGNSFTPLWKAIWQAGVPPKNKVGGVGVVLRDGQGHFLAAAASFLPTVTSALQAEMLAIKRGVELAHQLGFQKVLVRSDSSQAISIIHTCVDCASAMDLLAGDVLHIAEAFTASKFISVSRNNNSTAHCLAKVALSVETSIVWVEKPPSVIQDLLIQDIL
ncbi:uncharacterized protein [Malus domestica]|uniref:uncharacterized protein n=1 Tax=Malus domestica TaxID=3750 RepID=UPI0010AA7A91|nr:uncharacterized protein LOC108172663 [Malus domestica]